jgi:ABC-type Na+ transport system ATPase subunit NatA
MAAIQLDHLTKRFGSVVAVDNLSLTVESGNVVGFLGFNGAGKTTTLRMLLGLVTPTSTSRPTTSIPKVSTGCVVCSRTSPPMGGRCWSPATSWPSPRRSTASSS